VPLARLTPFAVPEGSSEVFDAGARQGRNFAPERADGNVNVFEAVVGHVSGAASQRKKVIVALWSEGSRDRMGAMLRDHKLLNTTSVNTWRIVQATPRNETMLAVLGMESGFETGEFAVISEQDILGDRLVRPRKASRKLDNFISEVTSLATGDLVVHVEHGIGRFVGLQTLEVSGAPHDCLELHYAAETNCSCRSRTSSCCRATAPTAPMSSSTARWRRLAGAQGQAEEPHPRDRGRIDQDRRRAAAARSAEIPVAAACL
jgi:transcription-repair coupling factor (superfamily II helicase)